MRTPSERHRTRRMSMFVSNFGIDRSKLRVSFMMIILNILFPQVVARRCFWRASDASLVLIEDPLILRV